MANKMAKQTEQKEIKKSKRALLINCKLNRLFPSTLNSFIELGNPIEVGLGKYSSWIKTVNSNKKYKFLTKMQTKKTFIGYAKILKDLKRPEVDVVLSDIKDNIKEKDNTYFDFGFCETKNHNNAVCVDLNSAYLQALFNLTLITQETKDWIEKNLKKTERLVAVGMLAKQKQLLTFDKGRLTNETFEEAKNRFIFNAVIQEVGRVMNKIKTHHIEDFIAYWVDGVYVKNEFIAFYIQDEFEKEGFPCKIEYLQNFTSKFKMSYMEYTYIKDGKFKLLNMPIKKVHDERKKHTLAIVNSKRILENLEPLKLAHFEKKVYYQPSFF